MTRKIPKMTKKIFNKKLDLHNKNFLMINYITQIYKQ